MFVRMTYRLSSLTMTHDISNLPAAGLEEIFFVHLADVEAFHGVAEFVGGGEDFFRVLIIGGGEDDGFGALGRIAGLENSGADENGFGAKLHHKRGVGGSGDAAGGKIRHGKLAGFCDVLN